MRLDQTNVPASALKFFVMIHAAGESGTIAASSSRRVAQLGATLRHAAVDEDIRCIVLCGSDAFFSAGADIKEMQQRGFEAIDKFSATQRMAGHANFSTPLIADVEGICFGGGHE